MISLLLNKNVWIALVLVAAFVATGFKCYEFGKQSVQADFEAYKNEQVLDALEVEQTARHREKTLQLSNQKVSKNYEALKEATAVAVSALDTDRMRLQATLDRIATNNSITGNIVDAAPEIRVLGQCFQHYEGMAVDAQRGADQVIALQQYITQVCQAKP